MPKYTSVLNSPHSLTGARVTISEVSYSGLAIHSTMEGESSASATMGTPSGAQQAYQPHPDSQLADLGRILPTATNPKGYPLYDVTKVISYTNSQIAYYLKRNMIRDLVAFQRAKRTRDEIFRGIDHEPVSDNEPDYHTEPTEVLDPSQVMSQVVSHPTPQVTPRVTPHLAPRDLTLENDDELDDIFPESAPNEKGLKIDKISPLKHDGGIINYRVWLNELDNVFEADPARYTTATKRVTFASMQMDDNMKSLWSSRLQTHPHLRRHWRKFLRWVEQSHLHGESDRHKHLQQYHNAMQGESEEPAKFYARLSVLATILNRRIDVDDFFPRLQQGLQTVLIRTQRKSKNVEELLAHAQEVWATFKPLKRKRENNPTGDGPRKEPQNKRFRFGGKGQGQAQDHPRRNKISEEELKRRRNNNLCLRCGKGGHFAAACTSQPQGGPANPPDPGSSRPPQVQPTRPQHALRQNFNEYKRAHIQPVETADSHQLSDDSDSDYKTDGEEDQEAKN